MAFLVLNLPKSSRAGGKRAKGDYSENIYQYSFFYSVYTAL